MDAVTLLYQGQNQQGQCCILKVYMYYVPKKESDMLDNLYFYLFMYCNVYIDSEVAVFPGLWFFVQNNQTQPQIGET